MKKTILLWILVPLLLIQLAAAGYWENDTYVYWKDTCDDSEINPYTTISNSTTTVNTITSGMVENNQRLKIYATMSENDADGNSVYVKAYTNPIPNAFYNININSKIIKNNTGTVGVACDPHTRIYLESTTDSTEKAIFARTFSNSEEEEQWVNLTVTLNATNTTMSTLTLNQTNTTINLSRFDGHKTKIRFEHLLDTANGYDCHYELFFQVYDIGYYAENPFYVNIFFDDIVNGSYQFAGDNLTIFTESSSIRKITPVETGTTLIVFDQYQQVIYKDIEDYFTDYLHVYETVPTIAQQYFITDSNGVAIEDAKVTAQDCEDNPCETVYSEETDWNGILQLWLEQGKIYYVTIQADGYTPTTQLLSTTGEQGEKQVRLSTLTETTYPAETSSSCPANFIMQNGYCVYGMTCLDSYCIMTYNWTRIDAFYDGNEALLYTPLNETTNGKDWFLAETNQNFTMYNYELKDGELLYDSDITSTGKYNNGLELDGEDDHINFSEIKLSQFTVGMWVYPTVLNNTRISLIGDDPSGDNYIGLWANQGLRGEFDDGAGFVSSTPSNPLLYINEWAYITITYNTSTITYYINGESIDTDIVANKNISFETLGKGYSTYNFNGTIDEVRVWNTTLTNEEITKEMNSRQPLKGEKLLLSYSFEDYNTTHIRDTNYLIGRTNSLDEITSSAYNFDGVDDVLVATYNPAVNKTMMCLWYYLPTGAITETYTYLFRDKGNWVMQLYNNSGQVFTRVTIEGITDADIYEYVNYDEWSYWCGGYNGTHILSYQDGWLKSESATGTVDNDNYVSEEIFIGADYANNRYHFPGMLSGIQLFNRSLTLLELKDLETGEFGGIPNPVIETGLGYNATSTYTGSGAQNFTTYASISIPIYNNTLNLTTNIIIDGIIKTYIHTNDYQYIKPTVIDSSTFEEDPLLWMAIIFIGMVIIIGATEKYIKKGLGLYFGAGYLGIWSTEYQLLLIPIAVLIIVKVALLIYNKGND